MRKIAVLLLILAVFTGCGQQRPVRPTFDFAVPEGFSLGEVEDDRCDIRLGSQTVGGFVATGLDPQVIQGKQERDLAAYLDSCGPMAEYISIQAEGYLSISLKTTDPETGFAQETVRYIFQKDGICYDLWLDSLLVQDDLRQEFLKHAGIM